MEEAIEKGIRRSVAPEISEKARALAKRTGIPYPEAVRVTSGEAKLNDVLMSMLEREKARKFCEEHRIRPDLAGNVIRGKIKPERALLSMRLSQTKAQNWSRSCFADAFQDRKPWVLFVHGRERLEGTVVGVEQYDFRWRDQNGQESVQRKLDTKFACPASELAQVEAALGIDPDVRDLSLGAIERPRDRQKLKNHLLQSLLEQKARASLVTLEGEILTGRLEWFSKYELGLFLENGARVTILRHAVQRLT